MKAFARFGTLFGCLHLLVNSASALPPDQVFARAAPSVVMVIVKWGNQSGQGSGVVVGREKVITNCHVVLSKNGRPRDNIVVNHQGNPRHAFVRTSAVEYDTCLLDVPDLTAPPIPIANLETIRVGQRVFAIGAPSGLDLTLTEGLISSLRLKGNTPVIQTSAAMSEGSSGGGLFDENGALIGITSFSIGSGTGLNFAYRADRVMALVSMSNQLSDQTLESLSASVNAEFDVALADRASTEPRFTSAQEKIEWLAEMSKRLDSVITDRQTRLDFLKTLYYESHRAGLDPQLVLALSEVASSFKKYAVSSSGARGYLQVAPSWVSLIGKRDHVLFHLRTNLRYGCTILRHYTDLERGNLHQALARYHRQMIGRNDGRITPADMAFSDRVRKSWDGKWQYGSQGMSTLGEPSATDPVSVVKVSINKSIDSNKKAIEEMAISAPEPSMPLSKRPAPAK